MDGWMDGCVEGKLNVSWELYSCQGSPGKQNQQDSSPSHPRPQLPPKGISCEELGPVVTEVGESRRLAARWGCSLVG